MQSPVPSFRSFPDAIVYRYATSGLHGWDIAQHSARVAAFGYAARIRHPLAAGFRPPRPRLSGVPFRLFRNAKRKIFMRLAGSSRPGTGFPASHAPHMALALVGQAGLEPATHCHMEPVHQPIAQSHYLLRHCPILPVFPGWAGNHSQRVRLAITLPDGFWRCITLRSERRTRTQKKGLLVAGFRPPRPRLSVVPFRLFRNANKKEILEGCPGHLAGASGFEPAAAPLRRPFPWQDPACHGPVFPGCQQNKPGDPMRGFRPLVGSGGVEPPGKSRPYTFPDEPVLPILV